MLPMNKQGFPGISFKGITPVSPIRDTFELIRNPDGSETLVKNGSEDIVAIIQSSREMSLNAILDRYLDETQNITFEDELALRNMELNKFNNPFESTAAVSKLDLLCDYYDMMEDTREALSLPDTMSFTEISAYLEKNYKKIMEDSTNAQISQNAPQNGANQQPKDVQTDGQTSTSQTESN